MPSHYELLEISTRANTCEVQAAYRTQAFRHYLNHAASPQANGPPPAEQNAALSALQCAYETLCDPQRRRLYDAELSRRAADRNGDDDSDRDSGTCYYSAEIATAAMDNFMKAIEALETDQTDLRSWRDLAPALLHPRLPQPLRHTLRRFAYYWGFHYNGPGQRTVQDVARQVVHQYENYYRESLWPERPL